MDASSALRNPDGPGLVVLGARQEQGEDAVAILGLHALGIDLHRQGNRAVEAAGRALGAMEAALLAVIDRLGARDTDGPSPDLDVQIVLPQAWHLGDDDDIVAFAKDVERRISAAAAQAGIEPV